MRFNFVIMFLKENCWVSLGLGRSDFTSSKPWMKTDRGDRYPDLAYSMETRSVWSTIDQKCCLQVILHVKAWRTKTDLIWSDLYASEWASRFVACLHKLRKRWRSYSWVRQIFFNQFSICKISLNTINFEFYSNWHFLGIGLLEEKYWRTHNHKTKGKQALL